MGNVFKSKQRLDYATMTIKFFEENSEVERAEERRCYDSDNPI